MCKTEGASVLPEFGGQGSNFIPLWEIPLRATRFFFLLEPNFTQQTVLHSLLIHLPWFRSHISASQIISVRPRPPKSSTISPNAYWFMFGTTQRRRPDATVHPFHEYKTQPCCLFEVSKLLSQSVVRVKAHSSRTTIGVNPQAPNFIVGYSD